MLQKCLYFLLIVFLAEATKQRVPCKLKQVDYGYVCVNDINYCDTLEVPVQPSKTKFTLVTTSLSGDRFDYSFGHILPRNTGAECQNSETIVKIDRKIGGKFVGFGGGLSGAVSYVLNRLPEKLRRCVYNSYFSKSVGMELSMLRVTMGGTSFDLEPWTYNETPENDLLLSNFTQLDPRDVQRNRQIKEITNLFKHSDFKIMSVPYSAPPWMKGNNNFVGGAGSQLKVEYYQTWADYYVKYLHLMNVDGVPIWAVTTGDEPVVASMVSEFEFMGWNAVEQGKWIANHLGPTLRKSPHKKVKILAFDDNRPEIVTYLGDMESGAANVMSYVDAIAVHGHVDWRSSPNVLNDAHEKYPNKPLLMSEKSFGIGKVPPALKGVLLGSWERAENFTVELIDNFNHNVTAFLYWNFILDNLGGPNYAKNYVDSPIIVDQSYNSVYKQPMFYAFAHFAKFIPVNSEVVRTEIGGDDRSLIRTVTYVCPDGSISMVLYNISETKTVTVLVVDRTRGEIRLNLKPKSINTLLY